MDHNNIAIFRGFGLTRVPFFVFSVGSVRWRTGSDTESERTRAGITSQRFTRGLVHSVMIVSFVFTPKALFTRNVAMPVTVIVPIKV